MSGLQRTPADGLAAPALALDGYDVPRLLQSGAIGVLGRLPYSSNYTFLAEARAGGVTVPVVYKPRRGERPLWDFPPGTLAAREVAAYVVAQAAGLDIVPPTVLRAEGPLGSGSLQLFIEHDPNRHYFVLADEREQDFPAFAAFDIVINNADRKAGHVIEDGRGRLWAVDHGLAFNTEDKLRTVIWDFAADPLGADVRDKLVKLRGALLEGGLHASLEELLSPEEAAAVLVRTEALLEQGRFPAPDSQYRLPWPLV
jgi:hypothetical protein